MNSSSSAIEKEASQKNTSIHKPLKQPSPKHRSKAISQLQRPLPSKIIEPHRDSLTSTSPEASAHGITSTLLSQPKKPQNSQDNSRNSESMGVWVRGVSSHPNLNPIVHEYLLSIDAFSMPLRENRDGLINLYLKSIHKLLPLLDMIQFVKLHSIGQAPTLLLHAVLLVAARHPQANQFLAAQAVRDFCVKTAEKIKALLFAEVEQDRLTLVRVYALLSLHSEGPDGLENSCADLQKAVHYSVSLGIHHESPFVDRNELRKLWWSVWCLDRINACVNARPLIINLEDVSAPLFEESEDSNLHKLVQCCLKLEHVIYLYRPNSSTRYNPLMISNSVYAVSDEISAVFSLLNYTAIILAHKRSIIAPKKEQDQSKILLSSAHSIHKIIEAYKQTLPPLPLIPYCVSLTLTVFLRTLPQGEDGWRSSCQLLEELKDKWWVADAMCGVGTKVTIKKETSNHDSHLLDPQNGKSIHSSTPILPIRGIPSKKNNDISNTGVESVIPEIEEQFSRDEYNTNPPDNEVSNFNGIDISPLKEELPIDQQLLDMFSQLPNPTSFLDTALANEQFGDISEWFR